MKTLTLLRHAKSGWDDPGLRDFDRPLNPKGRRAAATMGRHLRGLGLGFDHAIASPARRVVETIAEIEAGYGGALAPAYDRRLYLASVPTLLDLIHALPAGAERVLVVGHNPGLEELTLLLAAAGELRDVAAAKYPTATMAAFTLADWTAAARGAATLTRFVRPRDLDPALGPDD